MITYSIRHEVGIKGSPKAIYDALTDTKMLAGWWTSVPKFPAGKEFKQLLRKG